ncbi:pyridoxamine 5'-phosphate oxidase family protein [Porticoccus sp.]
MNDESPFHPGERQAQRSWGTTTLWTAERQEQLLWESIPVEIQPRIESAPFFFLATSDDRGHCDCSFKGGGPGLVRVIDDRHFAFPDFDGNGAFMSLGNILCNPHVGCLFIDFTDGARLRINGLAKIIEAAEAKRLFPDADRAIVVAIKQVIPNCAKYIPKLILNNDNTAKGTQK